MLCYDYDRMTLQDSGATDPGEFVELIYCARLRDSLLRQKVCVLFWLYLSMSVLYLCSDPRDILQHF